MPHIAQLSPHVADLIAAGEVVERPASVVKELLENAIDAGANAVTVEIQSGGMTYIRVSDDGCGIAPEELPTAFLRHATSKLRKAEDLGAIGTLGFRGEALAAISAVSRLDIFSRQKGADSGATLHLEGGVPNDVREAGCPDGTSIIVRDLFFNTPARLKFMKRDSAESTAIAGLVSHLALSHPNLCVKLIRDGEEVLHTPGDGVLKSAVYAALGRDFALSLLPVHATDDAMRAEGFVTAPLSGRGTRGMQTFFVNGRFVKSQLLTAALEEAYANRQMKGKFPGCVLFVSLPFDAVDVNVHPAKTIVKFLNEKRVFDLVYHAVCDALDGGKKEEKAPSIQAVQNPRGDFFQTMTTAEFRTQKAAPPSVEKHAFQTKIPPVREAQPALRVFDVVKKPAVPVTPSVSVKPAAPGPIAPKPAPQTVILPVSEPPAEQTTLEASKEAPWRIVGELLHTYIVCEDEEQNAWLIDKHAAHERINFDRLKANAAPIMTQPLLTPLVATFSAGEYTALTEHFPLLQTFGFLCEEFGDGSIIIREIPADIAESDAVPALEELAEKLTVSHDADPNAARDELLHTIACKAAIKGGWTSDEKELRALVDRVQSGEVKFCPHGRPVAVKLTKYELEKMFKRA